MNWKNSFHPYAMTTIVCWSLAYVFTRMAAPYLSAYAIALLRIGSGAAALGLCAKPLKLKLPARKDWGWFLLAGAVGFFCYIIAFNKGCELLPSATSSLVIATVPVMTALLARVLYRERLRGYQWAAIFVAISGVAVLSVLSGGLTANLGVLWLLGAAVAMSGYNLLQRQITRTYSATQASAYGIFVGTAMLAVFLPATAGEISQAPVGSILCVVVMGVLCTGLAYIAWAQAFAKAEKTSQVSNYMFFTPLITSILGFLMAGEVPDVATLVGGAVILLGMVLFNFGGRFFATVEEGQEVS